MSSNSSVSATVPELKIISDTVRDLNTVSKQRYFEFSSQKVDDSRDREGFSQTMGFLGIDDSLTALRASIFRVMDLKL